MAINIVQALNAVLFHLQACEAVREASNCRLLSVSLFGFSTLEWQEQLFFARHFHTIKLTMQ